jgi:hypothetical protein
VDEAEEYSEVVREGLQLRYPDTHFFFDSIACRAMRFQKRQGLMEGNAFDTIARSLSIALTIQFDSQRYDGFAA